MNRLYSSVPDCWSSKNSLVCDYCNSLLSCMNLSDCPLYLLSRLHKVQNSAAILVFKACKWSGATSSLVTCHSQNRLQTVNYLNIFFSDSSPTYIYIYAISLTFPLCTSLSGKLKTLASAFFYSSYCAPTEFSPFCSPPPPPPPPPHLSHLIIQYLQNSVKTIPQTVLP